MVLKDLSDRCPGMPWASHNRMKLPCSSMSALPFQHSIVLWLARVGVNKWLFWGPKWIPIYLYTHPSPPLFNTGTNIPVCLPCPRSSSLTTSISPADIVNQWPVRLSHKPWYFLIAHSLSPHRQLSGASGCYHTPGNQRYSHMSQIGVNSYYRGEGFKAHENSLIRRT